MDVYEFLREQRSLQQQRLNLVNPDQRTAFMKRALNEQNQTTDKGRGHPVGGQQRKQTQRQQIDSQQNIKRMSLMLNGKSKVMSDFGQKDKVQSNGSQNTRQNKNSLPSTFKQQYSPSPLAERVNQKLKANASVKTEAHDFSQGRMLTKNTSAETKASSMANNRSQYAKTQVQIENTPASNGNKDRRLKTPQRGDLQSKKQSSETPNTSTRLQRGTRNLKEAKFYNCTDTSNRVTSISRRVSIKENKGLWAKAEKIPHSSIQTIDSEQNSTSHHRTAVIQTQPAPSQYKKPFSESENLNSGDSKTDYMGMDSQQDMYKMLVNRQNKHAPHPIYQPKVQVSGQTHVPPSKHEVSGIKRNSQGFTSQNVQISNKTTKGARPAGGNNLAYSILKSLDDRRMRNGLLVRFQQNMQQVQGQQAIAVNQKLVEERIINQHQRNLVAQGAVVGKTNPFQDQQMKNSQRNNFMQTASQVSDQRGRSESAADSTGGVKRLKPNLGQVQYGLETHATAEQKPKFISGSGLNGNTQDSRYGRQESYQDREVRNLENASRNYVEVNEEMITSITSEYKNKYNDRKSRDQMKPSRQSSQNIDRNQTSLKQEHSAFTASFHKDGTKFPMTSPQHASRTSSQPSLFLDANKFNNDLLKESTDTTFKRNENEGVKNLEYTQTSFIHPNQNQKYLKAPNRAPQDGILNQLSLNQVKKEEVKSGLGKVREEDKSQTSINSPEKFPVSDNLDKMHKNRSFKLKRECPPYRQSLDSLQQHAEEMKAAAAEQNDTIHTEIAECPLEHVISSPQSPALTSMDQRTIEENINPQFTARDTQNVTPEKVVKPQVILSDGFNITNLAEICTPGQIEHCPFSTSGATYDTSFQNYIIGQKIGQGAYAQVRKAVYKPTDQTVAVKIYEKGRMLEPNRRRTLKREIQIMERISHPALVSMREAFESKKQVILVQEYVAGGNLQQHLREVKQKMNGANGATYLFEDANIRSIDSEQNIQKNKDEANMKIEKLMDLEMGSNPNDWAITEIEAKFIWLQVLYGVNYLHERHIIHRDVKLENVIFDKTKSFVKLVDFGFSTCVMPKDSRIKIFCGTPTYMAPEIVSKDKNPNSLNQAEKGHAGPPADIWALGVVLYLLLSGKFPFKPPKSTNEMTKDQRNKILFKKICKEDLPLHQDMPENITKEARQLLNKIFNKLPQYRPSTEQILNDPWLKFTRYDQDLLAKVTKFRPQVSECLSYLKDLKNLQTKS